MYTVSCHSSHLYKFEAEQNNSFVQLRLIYQVFFVESVHLMFSVWGSQGVLCEASFFVVSIVDINIDSFKSEDLRITVLLLICFCRPS